jgi:tol-pal system protein YbgF
MESLEVELRQVRDQLERLQALQGHAQAILDLQRRVAFLEQQLAIEPDPSTGKTAREQSTQPVPAPETVEQGDQTVATEESGPPAQTGQVVIRNSPISDDEQAFREAYSLVGKGALKEAEPLMREFVKKYKQSKYAANAVYWIGEALYARGKYSEAVLEFDRVIKEYPGSEKELSALLKQGRAFEKMGDKESARIILEKLIKKHPHTAQARLAKSRLTALKKSTPKSQ